ncbi:hypothetical protein ACFL2J_07050, partial [Candidatus Omnitrophota bacterium]
SERLYRTNPEKFFEFLRAGEYAKIIKENFGIVYEPGLYYNGPCEKQGFSRIKSPQFSKLQEIEKFTPSCII